MSTTGLARSPGTAVEPMCSTAPASHGDSRAVSFACWLQERAKRRHDELLERGRLTGAALDVFATEPLPAGHPFWTHPRVLVAPHVSAVSGRFWERETALIVDNIRSYLAGAPLTNLVDLEAGY